MCVIVVKPLGIKLKKAYWEECFRMNGHGAGLTYVEDNKLIVDKGYFKFDELYKEIEKHEDKEMVVHFRVSSAGSITKENCHPFHLQSKNFPEYSYAVAHNGTLDYRSTKDESDTNLFVNEVLGPQLDMHPWFLDNFSGQWFLKKACDGRASTSKMVVFRYNSEKKESKIYITNKILGTDDMGCWFSNTSYRLPWVNNMFTHGDYEYEDDRFFGNAGFMSNKDWSHHGFHQNEFGRWVSNKLLVRKVSQPKELPPGVSVLPSKEDQQKQNAALALSDSSVKSNIVVPRDDEVNAERIVAAKNRELRFNQRLEHLTKKGKKILRRMATDYAKQTVPSELYHKLSLADHVQDFRDTVRYSSTTEEVMQMEDSKLDEWIVQQYIEGNKNPECIADPTKEADTPDVPDEIDEAVQADAKLGYNVEQFPRGDYADHGDPINI